MKTDKKIIKALQKDLQPKQPFDEFCAENGIEVKRCAPKKKVPLWKKLAIPFAAVAAVLCIVLPITLTRGGGDDASSPSVGDRYNVGNEVIKVVDFSELRRDADLVLYNTDYEKSNSYAAFLCSEDDGLRLAYVVKNVVYGGQVDGTLYAYTFDFLARCYDGYAKDYTLVLEWYKQNGMAYVCDNVNYYYGIVSGADGTSAVICYENGKYDYFIRMRLAVGGTVIKNSNVKDFITLAFGNKTEEK